MSTFSFIIHFMHVLFPQNQNGTITYNLVPSATVSIQGGDTRERNDADNMDQVSQRQPIYNTTSCL